MKLPYTTGYYKLIEKDDKYFIEEWDRDYHTGNPYVYKTVEIDKCVYIFINSLYSDLILDKRKALTKLGKEEAKKILCEIIDNSDR